MKDKFYLACFRDNVGSNVSFHCVDGKGYSTNIEKAHVYTRAEAQKEWDTARECDQPISADHVNEKAVWKVDCQLIPNETLPMNALDYHVAFKKNKWDGNDVYFLNIQKCSISSDFSKASKLTTEEASDLSDQYIVIPYSLAESVKRRTFSFRKFNPRKMVQGAGLKTPAHIKQIRRKKESHKSKWNCPSCGRITWQDNPYDFQGCKNIKCKEWSYSA